MSSSSMANELIEALQRQHLDRISRSLRTDSRRAASAVDASVPLLFQALANNVRQPGGAEALYRAIENDHDGAVMGRLEDMIDSPESGPGAGILRHVFGASLPAVEDSVGRFLQLDGATINRLMTILAPLVLGILGQRRTAPSGGYNQQRLPQILEHEERNMPRGGGIGDILGDILRGGQGQQQQQPQGGGFPQGGFPQGGNFPQQQGGGFPPQGQGGSGFPQGGFPPSDGGKAPGGLPGGGKPGCGQLMAALKNAKKRQ